MFAKPGWLTQRTNKNVSSCRIRFQRQRIGLVWFVYWSKSIVLSITVSQAAWPISSQSKLSTSYLVLDCLLHRGNPAKNRVACSDCHLSFMLEDIPVCPKGVFHDPSSNRLEASYPPQGRACGLADCLRLVHIMLSQLNHGLMSTVATVGRCNLSFRKQVHTWLWSQLRGSSLALRFLRLRRAGEGLEKGAPSEDSGLWLPSMVLELLLEVELEQESVVCVLRCDRGEREEMGSGVSSEEGGGWQGHW